MGANLYGFLKTQFWCLYYSPVICSLKAKSDNITRQLDIFSCFSTNVGAQVQGPNDKNEVRNLNILIDSDPILSSHIKLVSTI